MLFSLNDDHRQIQDLIRKVAREKIAPRANEIDRTAEYPQDMFDLLKGLGVFSLPFPKEYGGTGSILSACVAAEELSRVCYNTGAFSSTSYASNIHPVIDTSSLVNFGFAMFLARS